MFGILHMTPYMYYTIMQFSLLLSRRQLPPTPPVDPSQIPQPVSKAICTDVVDGVGQYTPEDAFFHS